MKPLHQPHILLIISGSIAAYKSLDMIRLWRAQGAMVRCVLTPSGAQFVTPLSLAALSEQPVYEDMFSLKDETEMGHIRLAREADVIVFAPASADRIARMATGYADDLAGAIYLAAGNSIPLCVAPAMNPHMWHHPATQRNLAQIRSDGVHIIAPSNGVMACGEEGIGRLADPQEITQRVLALAKHPTQPLRGKRFIVTAGATHEMLDPVRFISNHSSGKQGIAIAHALRDRGAEVILLHGRVDIPLPYGITCHHTPTNAAMLLAAQAALPADGFIAVAAVADWKYAQPLEHKMKKVSTQDGWHLHLTPTDDILATIAQHPTHRPRLVIGFAAETQHLLEHAHAKRLSKQCDWIIANNVLGGAIFNEDTTTVHILDASSTESWESCSKEEVAHRLADRIVHF
ncbi:MAG: bifunctional phosphopantothenoylcysteine decarboxylase/phosphopantothenate--cysteine ligase CoaBC [Alphaproteobacteria bacterium]|nr:MAG: bifunctional phosphopantothenoylcysteine decarboxylase/phosphopantothenate--cysteine ligase CoaBC [Alphaproteobacteria bacterium]TAF14298.1 MAG: bifunctional phosphopantothenoylcysteine decarboxylase/phosphopantothenate--cysteine ligase CoaBC [Alphaproteobacteria bacterium]TAF40446.1 MAG: bifunctional phosphopantothenoylcysteine decarboxylase/phosphopantothenate--cysteine ligase CoaBC [Alphaproteobacteria bacterium]TAF76486.1 MAG: bifunctional phosphopantothenoylcysteine decarboxylase/ph